MQECQRKYWTKALGIPQYICLPISSIVQEPGWSNGSPNKNVPIGSHWCLQIEGSRSQLDSLNRDLSWPRGEDVWVRASSATSEFWDFFQDLSCTTHLVHSQKRTASCSTQQLQHLQWFFRSHGANLMAEDGTAQMSRHKYLGAWT